MRLLLRMTAAVALLSTSGAAHHASSTEFDVKNLIVMRGKIRTVEWINPHAWLHLEVKGTDGNTILWRIQGASPSQLVTRNVLKDSVKEGLEVSITVYPARSGETMADGATITFQDGKRIFFGGSVPVDGLDKAGKPCIIHLGTVCQ